MDLKEINITPKKIEALQRMGIDSVEDLLSHYPFRYEYNEVLPFERWAKGDRVCFEATIISQARVTRFGYKRSATRFKVIYDTQELDITVFNRPWLNAFKIDNNISVFGRYEGSYKVTCATYNASPIQEQTGVLPVYNVKEGMRQQDLRICIQKALQSSAVQDFVPVSLQRHYKLWSRQASLQGVHAPKSKEVLKQSIRTLTYEEFLKFQLQMQYMKGMHQDALGVSKDINEVKLHSFVEGLPYTLTIGQANAVQGIIKDMESARIMYRLLQGDVGCGKTAVAAIAMYAAYLSSHQSALLAPTEILAKQHYMSVCRLFAHTNVRVEVLYASMSTKDKNALLHRLQEGDIDILVGTHALFQEPVTYHNLGLVVADEQHRFGVQQRRRLLEKGDKVDFLLMSATPIPRTLAVSIFGDMDVSTIEDKPQGRKEIRTQYIQEDTLRSVLRDILAMVEAGEQCYVVCPAIEKNEEYEMRSVEELYASMCSVLGKTYSLALLHGKLSALEKDTIMNDFIQHKYQFLITTTVIEVGVDVKDANIMVIYDAHRFGMSQIHQLRGRVGRGDRQGYCYLLSGSKDKDAIARLQLCAQLHDGFDIAKADLSLRGAGDLLGVRQSGLSGFVLGDIVRDFTILETARNDALKLLENLDEYPLVHAFVTKKDYTSYLD